MDKIKGKKGVARASRRRVWRGQQDDGWARGRVNMSFDGVL